METTKAQQESKMDMQAMMDVYKKLGTPGAPHKMLASMVGSWKTKSSPGVTLVRVLWNLRAPRNTKCFWAGVSCSRSLVVR